MIRGWIRRGGHAGLCGTDGCRAVAEPRSGEKGPAGCGGTCLAMCISWSQGPLPLWRWTGWRAALLLAACLWLCRSFLFRKPAGTGVGEYGLCAFFSLMTLLCTAVRTQDTVAVLWENAFQVCKAGLFLAGMYLIFLMLLRALRKGLEKGRQAGLPSSLSGLRRYDTFWRLFAGDRGGVAAADLDPLPGRAHVGQLHADQAVHGRGGAHLQPSAVRHAGVRAAGLAGRGRGQPQPLSILALPCSSAPPTSRC